MPPKKRKVPAQSTTLLSFFNKPQQNEEVIVISDSDDDDDHSAPQPSNPKQRRTSSANSIVPKREDSVHGLASSSTQIIDLSEDDPEFEMSGAWTMDDDELATFVPDDDNEQFGGNQNGLDGECTPPADQNNQSCPLCSMSLLDLSEQATYAHVNACLDGVPSEPGPSTKPELKRTNSRPLRPASEHPIPKATSSRGQNAFSMLMSSNKDTEAWKEATEYEASSARGERRKAPFYKVLQGMPIAVDAFRYGKIPGVTAYFLSHAHSDHYTNLSSSWKQGPIYCSETTGNLIIHMLGVDSKWVHALPIDKPFVIPDTGGVEVVNIEANHCPGSSIFLFSGPQTCNAGDSAYPSPGVGSGKTFHYLHCGDFRASPQHANHPAIVGKKLELIYLDTTYCTAKYCFPPQPQVISACAELAKQLVAKSEQPKENKTTGAMDGWMKGKVADVKGKSKADGGASDQTGKLLVVVGTYSIGKERIVKAIAKALNASVFCDSRKRAILKCQTDPELHDMLSTNPRTSRVHIVPLQLINSERMTEYLDKLNGTFDRVVAFRPTGWTYSPPKGADLYPPIPNVLARTRTAKTFTASSLNPSRGSTARVTLYGVPYSEHSSFPELTAFALSVDWVRIIATVNVGSAASRAKMEKWFEKWAVERKARMRDPKGAQKGIVQPRAPDYW